MMPAQWEHYQTYIREHARTLIAELLPLLEQPSVSHQAADVRRCAGLLRDLLQHEGVRAEIMETSGNPVVYGEMAGERDDVTVVLYNHYDVKPVEPLDAWHSEPFRPLLRPTFNNPRQLMNYVGLTPSEYSSGPRRQQGSMTKTGTTHARRALVEGAWASRYPAQVSRHLQLRLEKRPAALQAISGKAHVRLCKSRPQTLPKETVDGQVKRTQDLGAEDLTTCQGLLTAIACAVWLRVLCDCCLLDIDEPHLRNPRLGIARDFLVAVILKRRLRHLHH